MNIDLRHGDCLEKLKDLPNNSVDSIVTDPPYGIGFMNKEWDSPQKHMELIEREQRRSEERFNEGKSPAKAGFSKGVQPGLKIGGAKEGKWFQEWCELWGKECLRVLKPGGYLVSFSAPRTYHRMTTGLEDAGFEIRDQLMWVFGSGFPKSHNIGKAIDKLLGNEREVVGIKENKINFNATKEGDKSFYENAWQNKDYVDLPITKGNSEWEGWGTALKPAHEPIVLARKPLSENTNAENVLKWGTGGINIDVSRIGDENGRWPANIMFDEGEEPWRKYFYCPKASKKDRDEGLDGFEEVRKYEYGNSEIHSMSHRDTPSGIKMKNFHPTVKPTELMLYLIKLVTPKGGVVLDPFMGSGSTGKAAVRGGYNFIGIEKEEEYIKIAQARINNEN